MSQTTIPLTETPVSRPKYRPLLLSLLLLLYPYLERHPLEEVVLSGLSAVVLLTGIYAVSRDKRFLVVACGLAIPALTADIISLTTGHSAFDLTYNLLQVVFYLFTTTTILWHILVDPEVMTDTLYGAACVYLLSGAAWSGLYTLIEGIQPGSFYVSAEQNLDQVVNWSDLLYFSYATLTTLGYGDITPVTSPARSLAALEAVFGVLYTAVLVARLVGLYRPPAPHPTPGDR